MNKFPELKYISITVEESYWEKMINKRARIRELEAQVERVNQLHHYTIETERLDTHDDECRNDGFLDCIGHKIKPLENLKPNV